MRSNGWNRKGVARALNRAVVGAGIVFGALVSPPADAFAQTMLPATHHPVGMTQLEFVDPTEGGRPLNLMLIYPAAPDGSALPQDLHGRPTCASTRTLRSCRTG